MIEGERNSVALLTLHPVLVIVVDKAVLLTVKVVQLIDLALEPHKLCSSTLTTSQCRPIHAILKYSQWQHHIWPNAP